MPGKKVFVQLPCRAWQRSMDDEGLRYYDAVSPPILVRKDPRVFPSAYDLNTVNGEYHLKIQQKIKEARARENARELQLAGEARSMRSRKGVTSTDAFVPYSVYDDAMVKGWLGRPRDVEKRFVKQTGTEVIPDDYLSNFEWQLRRINDGWHVIEDYKNLTVVGHVLSFRIKPDRAHSRLVLYEVVTRPCGEGLAFFRIALYQMLITCVQNGFELWVCSPLKRTQQLMRRISPEYGVATEAIVPHIETANKLWIRLPMEELLSPDIVSRIGIAQHVEGDLMADHARRIRAVTPLAWVRIPREPAVCRRMVVNELLLQGRRRQKVLGDKVKGYTDARTFLADLQELECRASINDIPVPDRIEDAPLTDQNDYTFHPNAWRFADPQTAAAEVLRHTGDAVHVEGELGTVRGIWLERDAVLAGVLLLPPSTARKDDDDDDDDVPLAHRQRLSTARRDGTSTAGNGIPCPVFGSRELPKSHGPAHSSAF